MKIKITSKLLSIIIASCVLLFAGVVHGAGFSYAASGRISLSTEKTIIKKGEVFTVVCRVSASSGVATTDFYVDYNTSTLKFVEGGSKATKEVGGVHINTADSSESPIRRTYSLKFFAKKEGEASIFIRDGAEVVDGEGESLSLRTDRIELEINEVGAEPEGTPSPEPVVTPEVQLSGSNKVKELTTNAMSIYPEFSPDIKEYEAVVDADTDTFFIDYTLKSKKATATIEGNRGLVFGENEVKLKVIAENGKKRTYRFIVTRLSEATVQEDDEIYEEPQPVSPAAINTDIPLDKEDKNSYSIILYIIIVLLAVFSVSMILLVRRQRKELDRLEEMEELYETEDDIRSGESDHESSEIRGQDGKPRDWY